MTSVTGTSSNGTAYYSTSGSGIDWSALIEAAVLARTAPAATIDTKITASQAKNEAYEAMQTLMQDLVSAADALRAPSGTSVQEKDVFQHRAAYLTAKGSVQANDSVAVTVETGSDLGSYDLEIKQLAQAHKVTSDTVTSRNTDLGYDGTFSLGLAGGQTVDIDVDADMTLDEIAEAINNKATTSGVRASVIKVADGEFQLLLTAKETGKSITTTLVSGDDVLANLGVTDGVGSFTNELQEAKKAIVELDGVEVTRDSNDIDDIIDGVTFHLYQTTPQDTSINVEVGTNLSDIKTAIQSFVDAYNAYRDFAFSQQQLTAAGAPAQDALLFGDNVLRMTNGLITDSLNTMVNDLSLANIGLQFDGTNHLVIDESKLDDALLNDLDGITSLFTFQMTSSSSDLMLLSRGSGAPTDFSLDVTVDGNGVITSAGIGGDTSMFTVNGTRIIGKQGTAYEGFTFVFIGSQSKTVDVSLSYGVADVLYNSIEAISDEASGTLSEVMINIERENTKLQQRADDIRSRADRYRDVLTARYARYEATIAEAESKLAYLDAFLNAGKDN